MNCMVFNLFGSNKEKLEQKQTQEIKEATKIPENKSIPNLNNSPQENNFQNPFSENQQVQTQRNEVPPLNTSGLPPLNLNQNLTQQNPNIQLQTNTEVPINTQQMPSNLEAKDINPFNKIKEIVNVEPTQDLGQIQEMIDETVEKLIEEKWEKLVSSVEKVLKWKEKQEKQMILIKEDIVSMSENLELVEKKIINKVSSYDKNILDVNSEIKALEKVFQKITPTLINNVNELSKIADDFKDAKIENKKLSD